jgi:hypothetical protein
VPFPPTLLLMRARFIWLLLVVLCAMRLDAQSPASVTPLRPGTRIRIDAPGVVSHNFVGTILLPPTDSLLLSNENGPPVTVRPAHITSLEVSRGRSGRDGAVRGLILGAPLGLTLGLLVARDPERICSDSICSSKRNRYGPAAATLIGAGVGLVAGALVGRERWAHLPLAVLPTRP